MRHPVQKGEGGTGRQMAEKSSLLTCSIKGGGWHKAQVIRALLLFQVIQLSDQDGKIHDGGFSPYSVVGQSGRWQRETLQPTKKAAQRPALLQLQLTHQLPQENTRLEIP